MGLPRYSSKQVEIPRIQNFSLRVPGNAKKAARILRYTKPLARLFEGRNRVAPRQLLFVDSGSCNPFLPRHDNINALNLLIHRQIQPQITSVFLFRSFTLTTFLKFIHLDDISTKLPLVAEVSSSHNRLMIHLQTSHSQVPINSQLCWRDTVVSFLLPFQRYLTSLQRRRFTVVFWDVLIPPLILEHHRFLAYWDLSPDLFISI